MAVIDRHRESATLIGLLQRHRIVGLLGVRQVGKTTLARTVAKTWLAKSHFFDLEDSRDLARLSDPMLALASLRGLIVIDEIQRRPGLFPTLRVLADCEDAGTRFLILGSASPELLRQSSETLAGRIFYHELGGLMLDEVTPSHASQLWLRGGLPLSYTAETDATSHEWRTSFIRTFLERDLPGLGSRVPASTLQRFWTMLAHYHGQIWNAAEFARSFGVSDHAVRHYLDTLTSSFVVRQLQPWFANISKRQVKAPKVYVADSGILHGLLNLRAQEDLEGHPKLGASWEGFVLDQLTRWLGADSRECYFWSTHAGAEVDLLVVRGSRRLAFEIKRTSSPGVTPSMRHALHDLEIDRLDVIHGGDRTFPLTDRIRAVSLGRLLEDIPANSL